MVTRSQLPWLLLLQFIGMLIGNIGLNLCYVGALVTVPIYFIIVAAAYDERFGIQSVEPKADPLASVSPTGMTVLPRETGNPYQSP